MNTGGANGEPTPSRQFLLDTSCPLYMALTGHEELLKERYGGRCYLPDEARVEIQGSGANSDGRLAGLLAASWWKPLAITESEDQMLFFTLLQRWGKWERIRGEAAAIVLARRLGGVAVVDDPRGLRAARKLSVPTVGTVAILARLVVEDRIQEDTGWEIHQELVQAGFQSPIGAKSAFLQIVSQLRTE